jgi:hypothetical protein
VVELAVNAATAMELGITLPPSSIVRDDKLIE